MVSVLGFAKSFFKEIRSGISGRRNIEREIDDGSRSSSDQSSILEAIEAELSGILVGLTDDQVIQ